MHLTDGNQQTFTSSNTISDLVNFINTDFGGASANYNSSTGQLSMSTARYTLVL